VPLIIFQITAIINRNLCDIQTKEILLIVLLLAVNWTIGAQHRQGRRCSGVAKNTFKNETEIRQKFNNAAKAGDNGRD
jgi:hypothetical protein